MWLTFIILQDVTLFFVLAGTTSILKCVLGCRYLRELVVTPFPCDEPTSQHSHGTYDQLLDFLRTTAREGLQRDNLEGKQEDGWT